MQRKITISVVSSDYPPNEIVAELNCSHLGLGTFLLEGSLLMYDEKFGDHKLCICTHPYDRHFDGYDNMRYAGCKYCSWGDCKEFQEK